jgi:hypothetical protein
MLLESPLQVSFNRVYFIIFEVEVWKMLIFEWILLLEIQKNCKNWVWNGKSAEPSIKNLGIFNFKNVKNKEFVHTWVNSTSSTSLSMKQSNFCFVCRTKISHTMVLHFRLLSCLEISRRVGVHRLGLRLFGATI